jgi:hypothetical protein
MLVNEWNEVLKCMADVAREKVTDGSWSRAEHVLVPRFEALVKTLADIAAKKPSGEVSEDTAQSRVVEDLNRLKADVVLERMGVPPRLGANWEDAAEAAVVCLLKLDPLVEAIGWVLIPDRLWRR